jgi:hypothetical protein
MSSKAERDLSRMISVLTERLDSTDAVVKEDAFQKLFKLKLVYLEMENKKADRKFKIKLEKVRKPNAPAAIVQVVEKEPEEKDPFA